MVLTAIAARALLRVRIYIARSNLRWLDGYCDQLMFDPAVESHIVAKHFCALADARSHLEALEAQL